MHHSVFNKTSTAASQPVTGSIKLPYHPLQRLPPRQTTLYNISLFETASDYPRGLMLSDSAVAALRRQPIL
jgi:hypothetical protein